VSWTTPADITAAIEKRWQRGDILAARITGVPLFPLHVRLKQPTARDIANRFGDVQDWARALRNASREMQGFGFELQFEELRSRVHGRNTLPTAAIIPTEADALRMIRRSAAADRFQTLADATLGRFPALREWLTRRPLVALEHADAWARIIAVLEWFSRNPRPGIHLRQIDIPGVDTKFIEAHRGLLGELLDIVLPEDAVDRNAVGVRAFNTRYGLRDDPPLVRFRLLDPALYVQGLSDISLPPDQFAALDLPVRVFITENRTNGLTFPDCPGSMVIFGLGYGLDRLADVPWLHHTEVFYWGDIDTHGFGILNRLRATLPHAQSLLMDHATLEAHRELWGMEPEEYRYSGDTTRLTASERNLLESLQTDRYGPRVRLEQERIGYTWIRAALRDLIPDPESPAAVPGF